MKIITISAILGGVFVLNPCFANNIDEPAEPEIKEARTLVKKYAGDLKATLGQALKSSGAVHAIQACNLQADPIANNISRDSSWEVNRTSLKVRNPNNKPDAWELKTLQMFEQQKAAGEDPKTLEYAELTEEDGKAVYRYMKAIPTKQVCLSCHGVKLDTGVSVKLKKLYPNDQAIGFNLGDIRGAFTFKKTNLANR